MLAFPGLHGGVHMVASRRRPGRIAALSLVLFALTVAPAGAGPLPELDVTSGLRPAAASRALATRARASSTLLRIATPRSVDERYEVPTMLWATRGPGSPATALRPARTSIEADARRHLGLVSGFYALQAVDVAEATLRSIHDTGHGGIVASFTQSVDGIDVFRDEVKVLMARDHSLIAVSGYIPSRGLAAKLGAPKFKLAAERVLDIALSDFSGRATANAARFAEPAAGGYERWDISAATAAWPEDVRPGEPARVKRVLFHLPDALVPAWSVELMAPSQAYLYVVSADDGSLLFRHDLMASDAFSYRVWAQTTGARLPHDGPQGTSPTPHPTGLPSFFAPGFVAPSLVTLQNGPISTNDPWLAPGATQTLGNNVDAYVDLSGPDGFSVGDFRASTTSANTFDRTYDVNQAPGVSSDQRMAAITQLFYDNNFFHDWYYDSGFDEASGNGQTNNFGRGGLGGDAIRAEAQDFSGTNNANMSTPPDGSPGRMQMYVFNLAGSGVTVTAPPSIAGPYAAGIATGFGTQTFNVTGDVVLGVDGAAPVNDGCSALTNGAQVAGKIALIERGICSFLVKAQSAAAAGAIACIIADNAPAFNPPGMGGSGSVAIPVLSVTQATGDAIKNALLSGTVTVQLVRQPSLARDGTIDNTVVAHEWGHFISNRLVGNASGLSTQMSSGLGEGWGDFHAMLMAVRPEDIGVGSNANWTGAYGLAGYALFPSVGTSNAYYFGIRRCPYSTDMNKNGLTFKHIQNGIALPAAPPTASGTTGANNAEVHNTGEVWCNMLWECYAALLRDDIRLTFAAAQQRMRDYVVEAYKLTPNAPTLLEARDALLLAAYANDLADYKLFWSAFAKRGAGAGAIAPGRFDANNATVVESFVTGGELALVGTDLEVSVHDCDADGYIDNGEVARITVTLKNVGSDTLEATTATLSSTNPHVGFPGGNTVKFAKTLPFQTASVTVPVELLGAAAPEVVDINASYNDPDLAVPGPYVAHDYSWGNTDEVPSNVESVEAHTPPWTMAGSPASDGQWATTIATPSDRRFLGPDVGEVADHTLTSPPLQVAPTGSFSFSFQHNFDFERDASNFYDGGVVELSNDGGANWTDIGFALSTGYNGTLTNISGNPLGGRAAYCGQSTAYPGLVTVNANLGTTYQGQTVRVRFRIACDAGVGAQGWQIATLTFNNILNQPFFALGPNAADCTPVSVTGTQPRELSFAVTGANPAQGSARFRFGLPAGGRVELAIYDVSGRRVATLAEGELSAGWHDRAWTLNDDGGAPASGVYFARMLAGGRLLSSRVVMLR